MAEERKVTITIVGENLTPEAFDKARQSLAGLKKNVDDTKPSSDTLSLSFNNLTKAAGLLGLSFGIGEIASFTKELLANSSAIKNNAERLDLSIDEFQRWKAAVDKNGGSIESLGNSVRTFNRLIGEGSSSTRELLGRLGLSMEELRLMDNKTRFEAVADAVGQLQDPLERDEIGMTLLGKGFAENLPAMIAGLKNTGDAASIMSERSVRAYALLDDAIGDTTSAAKNWGSEILLKLVPGLGRLAETVGDGQQAQKLYSQAMAGATQTAETQIGTTNRQRAEHLGLLAPVLDVDKAMADLDKTLGQTSEQQKKAIDQDLKRQTALENLYEATRPIADKERERIQLAISWFTVGGNLIATEGDIATAYNLSEAKVREVIAANKARADAEKFEHELMAGLSKTYRDNKAEEAKQARETADKSMKALADLVLANDDAQQRLKKDYLSRHDLVMVKIDDEERRELASAATKYDANSVMYANLVKAIRAHYDFERDYANGTASTIEQRMEDKGIFTKDRLKEEADAFKRDYDQMVLDGGYTEGQLKAQWDRWKGKVDEATDGAVTKHQEMSDKISTAAIGLFDALIGRNGGAGGWEGMKTKAIQIGEDILQYYERIFMKKMAGYIADVVLGWTGVGTTAATVATESAGASSTVTAGAAAASSSWAAVIPIIGAAIAAYLLYRSTGTGDPEARITEDVAAAQARYDAIEARGEDPWTYQDGYNDFTIFVAQNPQVLGRGRGFAEGGIVGAQSLMMRAAPSDIVPALLTPGEGIVTRGAMDRIGASGLDAINSGRGFDQSALIAEVRALRGAVEQMAGRPIEISNETVLDGQVIDKRITKVGQANLYGGTWRVPSDARVRSAP